MRKLTAEQILEIVVINYDVSSFAHGYFYELSGDSRLEIPEDLGKEEQDKKDEIYSIIKEDCNNEYSKYKEHPKYKEYESLKYSYQAKEEYILQQLGLGKIAEVDQYGGEGQGEDWYSVKHFVDHDVYIKTQGFYTSYHGTDFDYGYGKEVKPVERTVTFYE